MKRLIVFFLLFFGFFKLITAQTYVSGGIYTNTTWTKANSPYVVTDTIVVFPGVTLTLQPGVIVKFDKLNPTLAKQGGVPLVGEMIASRWAFEALGVNQFKANKYHRNFYKYDKAISIASYKKVYWIPKLQNKMSKIDKELKEALKKETPLRKVKKL